MFLSSSTSTYTFKTPQEELEYQQRWLRSDIKYLYTLPIWKIFQIQKMIKEIKARVCKIEELQSLPL